MNTQTKEQVHAVHEDIEELHAYYWPRFWKGIDPGHFAETLPKFTSDSLRWDTVFYVLDGGIGISITGSRWFQRLLGIRQKYEVKALAVVARAYANLHRILPYRYPMEYTTSICDSIWKHRSPVSTNPSWGSGFKWRTSTGHTISDDEPSSLVTALIGLAFLDAYSVSKHTKYLDWCKGIADYFLFENGQETYSDDSICFHYTPLMREPITNASAFVALFLESFGSLVGDQTASDTSERAYRFIINNQLLDGSWLYFPSRNRKENIIDNYHTGFILEALLEGLVIKYDREKEQCARKGLQFYSAMFRANGQPIFNRRRQYPIDIHDMAQGIIVFALSNQVLLKGIEIAQNIRKYADDQMKQPDGRYSSRVYRLGRSNLIMPRWADCWMFLGLTELLKVAMSESSV